MEDPNPTPSPTSEPESGGAITTPAVADNSAILATLRELDASNREMRQQLEDLKRPAPTPEPKPEELNAEFWKNPMKLRELIRADVAETVKPLIEFREEFKATNLYDKVKGEFKNDSRFKEFLAQPGVEGYIDQLMAKNPGLTTEKDVSNAFQSFILGLRGAMEMGLVPKPATPDTGKPANNAAEGAPKVEPIIPAHLRPSSAPRPSAADNKPKQRDLTENERRLAREQKLSESEYLELADLAPGEVIHWKSEAERKAAAK